MDHKLLQNAEQLNIRHRRKLAWARLVGFLSCIVVFCTTYALILPAITQEKEVYCGYQEHTHTEACYSVPENSEGHMLLCSPEDLEIHSHTEACYDSSGTLSCGLADYVAHTHNDSCYDDSGTLICAFPEHSAHVHGDDCYITTDGHTHGDDCYRMEPGELICSEEESQGHVHTEECSQQVLVCEVEAGHIHGDECYTETLACTEEHEHTPDCFVNELSCSIPESHVHEEACYNSQLICTLEESSGHVHTDACYESVQTLICQLEETEGERKLTCTEGETETHVHTDACFPLPEEPQLTCTLSEHTHTLACHSDPTADIESREVWEATFRDFSPTGNWAEDVLSIARTQLGYRESTKNYIVLQDGVSTKGYSRYGDWYGDPYGDWCAMFVSFCLSYAEVEDYPIDSNCQSWIDRLVLEDPNLYLEAGTYDPSPGDLIFFDRNGDGISDHVGIVSDITAATEDSPAQIETIEGNAGNSVKYVYYDPQDTVILGYGPLPVNPKTLYLCELQPHYHDIDCYDPEGTLLCSFLEHEHSEKCLQPHTYYCEYTGHTHGSTCFDDNDTLICDIPEHSHSALCLEPPRYYCQLEAHSHEEDCYDESGVMICELTDHIHSDDCLVEPPVYYCEKQPHAHTEACFDENGLVICPLPEHEHDEQCLTPTIYYCGLELHTHEETCYDELSNLVCPYFEHQHNDACLEDSGFLCGFIEHAHSEECMDKEGNPMCGLWEHSHSVACTVELRGLPEGERLQIQRVILLIESIPSVDELFNKIEEFEANEDYDGEEAWLTEVYQRVARAYNRYSMLPENLQEYVMNRDKLMELDFIWSMAPLIVTEVAKTIDYSSDMFVDGALFVVYTQSGNQYYAFNGSGAAIPISIGSDGTITADVEDKYSLLWTFANMGSDSYLIQNVSSGRYMHAYPNNGTGVTTSGAYNSTVIPSGDGVKIRSNTEYAYLNAGTQQFVMTQNSSLAAVYQFGVVYENYLWLDGTDGGLMGLDGSPNERYSVSLGDTFTLPTTWESPDKYDYTLRGWYDVVHSTYHAPGSQVEITGNMLFYADWVASTYNIGQFNSSTANTISTKDFITTRVFDYNALFNAYSLKPSASITAAGHSVTWSLVENGTVPYQNGESINFIFRDYDTYGKDISYPANNNAANTSGSVYSGLYDATIIDMLFGTGNSFDPATGTGVLGKQYLGTGDHLFQYGDDPSEPEHYGYYYYDSTYNAASYNQSTGRFYVYDYLERTTDSAKGSGAESYSDFLPFNSPYANTNGNTVRTYTYNGINGEFPGVNHYMYDAKYNTENNTTNYVGTNYLFGLSTEIDFFLANQPGTTDSEGNTANKSVYGDDLTFEFAGDDDVWVLIDGKLVLDLGGIHGVESGKINFSTGEVIVNGTVTGSVTDLSSGRHILTMYYLERGSSQSNFELRFNITPRYNLSIQKEDVLTRDLLNGAEFSVFTDPECTVPAQLWTSRESYQNHESPTNVFTVTNGSADMWGFSAGNTYYIKETKTPDEIYSSANGIIVMTLNNLGVSSYDVIPDPDAENPDEPSTGFTVHGFKVDYETQQAYLVATNSKYSEESTEIYAEKVWNDSLDHSATPVTVYLLADGVRIREEILNEDNDWKFLWDNLPKYREDGTTEVVYTVEEGTVPGYIGRIEKLTELTTQSTSWESATSFTNGGTYLLETSNGYLSANSGVLSWVTDEAAAKASASCKWVATVSGTAVKLTNEAGQTLRYSSSGRYFQSAANPSSGTSLTYTNGRLRYNSYYMSSLQSNGTASRTTSSYSALSFSLLRQTVVTETIDVEGVAFKITNTPITEDDLVSLKVTKAWNLGNLGSVENYETLNVVVRLLANGEDTGLTLTLNLKNNWTDTFTELPKEDVSGNVITYTVEEISKPPGWNVSYGDVTLKGNNTYETTVTNTYNYSYILPETGGAGTHLYTAGGLLMTLSAAVLLYIKLYKRRKGDGVSP